MNPETALQGAAQTEAHIIRTVGGLNVQVGHVLIMYIIQGSGHLMYVAGGHGF